MKRTFDVLKCFWTPVPKIGKPKLQPIGAEFKKQLIAKRALSRLILLVRCIFRSMKHDES